MTFPLSPVRYPGATIDPGLADDMVDTAMDHKRLNKKRSLLFIDALQVSLPY